MCTRREFSTFPTSSIRLLLWLRFYGSLSGHTQCMFMHDITEGDTMYAASNLIHAFISSRLDWGNSLSLWSSTYWNSKVTKGSKYSSSNPNRKAESVTIDRIDFNKIMVLAYTCLKHLALPYLSQLLEVHSPRRILRSGESLNLKVPQTCLKTYGDRPFCHAAPALWNDLPMECKTASSLGIF